MTFEVHQSQIKLARKCLKAHHYRYAENLERKKHSVPPFVGTILHEMLDARVRGHAKPWDIYKKYKLDFRKLWDAEKEEYGDIPAMIKAIYKGYLRRWKGDGLVYVDSEVSFRAPLSPSIDLLGTLDKIAEGDGRRILIDHKFHKNLPGPDHRFSDIQTVLYYWGWNETHRSDERLDSIMWDYGRMKAPTVPEELKAGGLSKRANIDTDVFTYRKRLAELGLDEKPYRQFLKTLEGKERTFFERVPLPAPSKHLIKAVVEDARLTAIMARKALRTGRAPRSMSGFNCNGCEFRTLCEAEVRGLDHKFVRKKEYKERDPKERRYGKDFEQAA